MITSASHYHVTHHAVHRLRTRVDGFENASAPLARRVLAALAYAGVPWGISQGSDRLLRCRLTGLGPDRAGDVFLVTRLGADGQRHVVTVLTPEQAFANQSVTYGHVRRPNRHQRKLAGRRERRVRELRARGKQISAVSPTPFTQHRAA